jgi:acetyl-CoA acetyltransferase
MVNGAARALGKPGDAEGVRRTVGVAEELLVRQDAPD